jgi:hypothetical protein
MSKSHNERLEVFKAILDKVHGINAKTQRERLKQALLRLGNVTTFEAMRFLDIYYCPSRKQELIEEGFDIALTWQHVETESGEIHRVGNYVLKGLPVGGVK